MSTPVHVSRPQREAANGFPQLPSREAIRPSPGSRNIRAAIGGSGSSGFERERLDTTTPGGRLVFHVFAALAEFIRELIVAGTREGLAAARARGNVGGRPTVVDENILRMARDMLPNPENSITAIAKMLGVSPGTLYNHIPDLRELRTGGLPNQLDGAER
ncbi:recombinase family protein [Streptomyces sp. NPDC059455]|uniref:recombinase family protein n=1 Tax=Streptomyces sp. NPDC059455 TaxID=3346837 RepID=UPI00369A9308